jgi:thiol-disulfide isomerase/thioredoxin
MLLTLQAGSTEVRRRPLRPWLLCLSGMLVAIFAAFSAPRPAAAMEGWLTNYEEALAAAERTDRPVLVLFTGSDWCPHCKTLEDAVLSTDTFRSWANDKVVLLMIDLPQNGISQAVRSERSQVCIKYGVRTFPSVLLLKSDGSKLAAQTGYTGQSAETWLTRFQEQMPAPQVAKAADQSPGKVHESLDEAVETARGRKRPILLVVARPGDSKARSHSESLINDPEFESFARENFVVAKVAPRGETGSQSAQTLENLLGGAELPPDSVELIVTDDGQTPLFSQSGTQPASRIVSGLRRFLSARQAARFGDAARR